MDLRPVLAISLLLLATLAFAPGANAAPCDTSPPGIGCEATVGRCDAAVGAHVVTSTSVGASADCRLGNMTRCYTAVAVGQDALNPSVERWCAF